MAGRIRTIKPEILDDERSAGLSDAAWRLWVSSWLLADDHGGARGDSRWLAAEVFWASPGPPRDVPKLLLELEDAGLVRRYTVRGQQYLCIVNWKKHQRVDNAGKPRVPTFDEADPVPISAARGDSRRISASVRDLPLDPDPDPDHEPKSTHVARARDELAPAPPPPPRPFDGTDFQEIFASMTNAPCTLYDALPLVEAARLCRKGCETTGDPPEHFARDAIAAFIAWRETCTPPVVPGLDPSAFVRNFGKVIGWIRDSRDGGRTARARGSPAPVQVLPPQATTQKFDL